MTGNKVSTAAITSTVWRAPVPSGRASPGSSAPAPNIAPPRWPSRSASRRAPPRARRRRRRAGGRFVAIARICTLMTEQVLARLLPGRAAPIPAPRRPPPRRRAGRRQRAGVDRRRRRNAVALALDLDVGRVHHVQRRDVDVARHPDPRLARVDRAQRRMQESTSPAGTSAIGASVAMPRARTRRVRRQRHVAERVIDPPRRRVHHRGPAPRPALMSPSARTRQDAAAERRHDPALPQQDAVARVELDVAAAPGSRRRALDGGARPSTPKTRAARRQRLDVPAGAGLHARAAVERDAAVITQGRALRIMVGEQGGDGLASAQIAALARGQLAVVFTAAIARSSAK